MGKTKKNIKSFALLGASGYVAKKHVGVLKDLKENLVLAYDKHNNCGYLDSFFPQSYFAKNENDFFDLVKKKGISYVIVCTPNYLHFSHIKKSLLCGANVICEKPTVLNLKELQKINKIQKDTKKNCFSIFQLRYNENISKLKIKVSKIKKNKNNIFNLKYVTYRGSWYEASWKNNLKLSGGLIMNIGVHFVDILTFLFGEIKKINFFKKNKKTLKGTIIFMNTKVNFLLSIEKKYLEKTHKPIRNLTFNKFKVNLTEHFENLHLKCYKEILNGRGISINKLLRTYENLKVIQNEIKK